MKILNISQADMPRKTGSELFKKSDNSNLVSTVSIKRELKGVPRAYALSFSGGYSLDLEQTAKEFRKHEEKHGYNSVPQRVKDELDIVLSEGNEKKLTLIDVHKKVYGEILSATTLDEIREKFPEFTQIKSTQDVSLINNPIVRDAKAGKSKIFVPDEDIALQLMKLYWAQGFSLKDISIDAYPKANIATLMEKLNIPRLTPHYGHVLKFSDVEYNKRFSEEMSLRQEEIASQRSGAPVVPRKMSEEQKKKISDALINYYSEHPEKIQAMTQRQKDFYSQNPEEAVFFKFVMLKTWNMSAMEVVRRKMSEYLKQQAHNKKNANSNDECLFLDEKSNVMKEFWDKNPYLKKKFSKSMLHAYEKMKVDERYKVMRNVLDFPAFPRGIKDEIEGYAKKKGIKLRDYDMSLGIRCAEYELQKKTKEFKLIFDYFDEKPEMFRLYRVTIADQVCELFRHYSMPQNKSKVGDAVIEELRGFVSDGQATSLNNLLFMYAKAVSILKDYREEAEIERLNNSLEKSFEKARTMFCSKPKV